MRRTLKYVVQFIYVLPYLKCHRASMLLVKCYFLIAGELELHYREKFNKWSSHHYIWVGEENLAAVEFLLVCIKQCLQKEKKIWKAAFLKKLPDHGINLFTSWNGSYDLVYLRIRDNRISTQNGLIAIKWNRKCIIINYHGI